MSKRTINFKPNKVAQPCPKCGNNTKFIIYSEQVAEDYCEIWATCGKCGYNPTENDTGSRVEDVWGGVDDNNCRDAVAFSWNDPILNTSNRPDGE